LRTVAFVVFERVVGLDVTGPVEVFDMANREHGAEDPAYRVEILSLPGGPVRMASGLELFAKDASQWIGAIDTLIVPGGYGIQKRGASDPVVVWVRRAAERCRRVCSVCTGAFVLAAAGLLKGRRAVTHWQAGPGFAAMYPDVRLDLRPIYIRDGDVWTSAGVTAGIDLALALVEQDLGRSTALAVAKQMVVFLHRPGGQAQFSMALSAQARTASEEPGGRFYDLHAWIADNLTADLSVQALSQRANMSRRSFNRNYVQLMGVTPAKAVEGMRIEAAKRALERGDLSIKRVAAGCGFGDDEHLRRAFVRQLGVTPDQYRERFQAALAGPPDDQAAA
jgi:transcriptional regulator GlxA family with amidase domain